jgi:hypothetical protein
MTINIKFQVEKYNHVYQESRWVAIPIILDA